MTLTNELQKSILSDKDLCFPVSQLPIGYLDQDKQWHRIGNKYAIVNQKTGETVSVVSHDYEVVPNEMILKIIEGSLMALRLKYKSSGVVFRGGAKFRGIYIIDNPVEIIAGDTLSPVIQVECSYDAVSKNRILLGAYRHVCLNLCVSGGTDWGTMQSPKQYRASSTCWRASPRKPRSSVVGQRKSCKTVIEMPCTNIYSNSLE